MLPILQEKIEKSELPSAFSRLFYVIFSMGQMIDEFSDLMSMSKRLERHIYPRLMEFIITISNLDANQDDEDEDTNESYQSIKYDEYQIFESSIPTEKDIFDSINNIMVNITSQPDLFKELYSKYTDTTKQPKTQSLLGSNYAIFISNFFVHCFDTFDSFDANDESEDEDQIIEDRHHRKSHEVNKMKQFESQTINDLTKMDKTDCIDPTKPRKFYKRVMKQNNDYIFMCICFIIPNKYYFIFFIIEYK